ncbi:hypothetical protein [Aureitalea marina]|uniref:Uncharacterized protein n=1 Tax=Aureitalea marina TaxID=930804 RepID=A0A2S7KTM7_9FLAO|nr:hypothetical protein [Aureitalea marina]PQB05989.1 hypothetical protein BST85_06830 [Aureitalea marina]
MKTDRYTRFILTIIAICLSINLTLQLGLIEPAFAATPDSYIPDVPALEKTIPATNTIDVRIVDINTYDELNVNIKSIDSYEEMKVNIKSIDTQDELDVNLDEIGGQWISSGDPLPVKLD